MTTTLPQVLRSRRLGTDVTITSASDPRRADLEIGRLEAILTRFQDSPLRRLNDAGRLENPPFELQRALLHAMRVAADTDGLVTPTVLPALEAAGYRVSFEKGWRPPTVNAKPTPVAAWQGVSLTLTEISLPDGMRLDLGGTAKSWIVEQAASLLEGEFVLDAGGDVALRQSQDSTVSISTPNGPDLYLDLPAGEWGVATSGTHRRRAPGAAGRDWHHLIDPRTGLPLRSRFVQVTAATARVTDAEVLAKVALLGDGVLLARLAGYAVMIGVDEAGLVFTWNGRKFVPAREASSEGDAA